MVTPISAEKLDENAFVIYGLVKQQHLLYFVIMYGNKITLVKHTDIMEFHLFALRLIIDCRRICQKLIHCLKREPIIAEFCDMHTFHVRKFRLHLRDVDQCIIHENRLSRRRVGAIQKSLDI